jgi:hypothetical protein
VSVTGLRSERHRRSRNPDFFLDFTFQWLYKRRMQQTIVAISINDGRENRTMATKKKAKKKKK